MTTLAKTSLYNISLLRSLSSKDLASRLSTSKEMARIFLCKYYPETHVKNKARNISSDLAQQIEKDYRNLVQAREAEKKLRIEKELMGELK